MLLGRTVLPTNISQGGSEAGVEARRDSDWSALRRASEDADLFINNSNADQAALEELYDRRNRRIHDLTGAQLFNPYRDDTPLTDEDMQFAQSPELLFQERIKRARSRWSAELGSLKEKFPQRAAELGGDIGSADVMALRRETDEKLQRASASPYLSTWNRLTAGIAGSFPAMLRDPMQVLWLGVGGSGGPARSILGKIAFSVMTEAAVNAGQEATLQGVIQKRRAEAGLSHGFDEAMRQIAAAGIVGGVVGGGIRGAGETVAHIFGKPEIAAPVERALSDRTEAGDVETIARSLDVPLDDLDRNISRVAEEQAGLDAAAIGDVPEGLDSAGAADLLDQGIRHAETPDEAPPAGDILAPARSPDVDRVVDERLPAPAPGARETVHGRPVIFARFDPQKVRTDAVTFQYKEGGDAAGVTDRLRDVKQWDATASGKVIVWERNDGVRFIADGHQRLGLARRLDAEGQNVRLDGYLFREKDGWEPADVRALAAKKNMQEGSGSSLDAARILRDRPEILDGSLPISGPMMKKATALARLSPDAWGMVVNGAAPEHVGAAVGRIVTDPERHAAVMREVSAIAPETERQTELAVREVLSAGFSHETQSDMFGALAVTKSLMPERVKVLDEALKVLSRDKRLFASLASNAELIEAAGNVLDTTGNAGVARSAETVMGLIDRLARARGPVSDMLTEAAERFSNGSTAAKEARGFVSGVREALDSPGGLKRLLEAPPQAHLKPPADIEPATAEAGEIAQIALLEASPEPPRTIGELYDRAPVHQRDLEEFGRQIEAETGAPFKSGGVKNRAGAEAKIARKGYDTIDRLTDVIRGGFTVDTPAKADQVAKALNRRYAVLDEGWKENPDGYVDRKVLVRFDDGTIGEVQLWEPHMLAAKQAEGHKLYRKMRELSATSPEAAQLRARMKEIYSAARAKAGDAWSDLAESTSSGPNSGSKRARQRSSDINPAVWKTSQLSTGVQGASRLNTANAEKGGSSSSNSTAGRRSQSTNLMGDTSETNIAAADKKAISSTGQIDAGEQSVWDLLPDGVDAEGRARFTDPEREAAKADLLDDAADLAEACKD